MTLRLFGALLLASIAATAAQAHTTSIGYVPGSTAGSVTFWTGSYDHGGAPSNEGAVTLSGVTNGYMSTQSFNIGPVSIKPTGLIDGTNNFFWGNYDGTRYPFPLSTDPVLFGGVKYWQGVTFTGLAAGDYLFGCGTMCGSTQQWESLNGAGDQIRITLTGGDIGSGVPEPATWALMILGFGAVGGAMRARARRVRYAVA
jgi:hypothetical protein